MISEETEFRRRNRNPSTIPYFEFSNRLTTPREKAYRGPLRGHGHPILLTCLLPSARCSRHHSHLKREQTIPWPPQAKASLWTDAWKEKPTHYRWRNSAIFCDPFRLFTKGFCPEASCATSTIFPMEDSDFERSLLNIQKLQCRPHNQHGRDNKARRHYDITLSVPRAVLFEPVVRGLTRSPHGLQYRHFDKTASVYSL